MAPFSRLIRFIAKDGHTYYGDAIAEATGAARPWTRAGIIEGDVLGQYCVTERIAGIQRLLSPLAPNMVGTVRCLDLNYADHARETGMTAPQFPVLFYKPRTALAGPVDDIPVPSVAQEGEGLDYECELVVIMGRQCNDVAASRALDRVLGYAVGNDVSHRDWQIKRGGGQWSHGKGFDGWAPFGPAIVSPDLIADPQRLDIWTRVNGEKMQDGNTADMIFGVKETIALLSRGVTFMPGNVIFTGTPAGVAMGRKPPSWLKDGDCVEVGIGGIGTCTNRVRFSKSASREAKL